MEIRMLMYIRQVTTRLRELVLTFLAYRSLPGSSIIIVLRDLVRIISFIIKRKRGLPLFLILFPALLERWKYKAFNVKQLISYYSDPLYILHLISTEYSYGKLEILRIIIAVIRHFMSKDTECKRLLDIGSGIGTYTAYISRAFPSRLCSIHFIDIGIPQVEIVKLRIPQGEGVDASATHLPYRSETFDYVISFDVLEHIEDPTPAVLEISRVLVNGGIALMNLPVDSIAADHICKISRQQFEALLNQSGMHCYK